MKISCDACACECEIVVNGPTLLKDALPRRWRPRRIDGRVYILCDVCGNLRQFVGGLSPYLLDRLGLARGNVDIELPEHTELPADWFLSVAARGAARAATPASPTAVADSATTGLPKPTPIPFPDQKPPT
ncbi:MAG: hypothetical protein NW217_11125 [Hyphomicrobiaceae bacterium]|nr:hypothetical protein [Hyphomicrobiaceae bacterium]